MTFYKLINEGCGQLLIDQLDEHLKSKQEKFSKSFYNETDQCPLQYFKKTINIIKKYQNDDINNELNNFIGDEYLTSTEAALLLNGLNPAAGSAIDSDIEGLPRDGGLCNYDILHDYLHENNKEFRQLSRAVSARDGFAFDEGSDVLIYTEVFISWAIERGFIEEVGDTDNQCPTELKYATSQKIYNSVVVLMALKERWKEEESNGKQKTVVSQLLQSEITPFYKSIESQLVSIYEDSNKLPSPKTLKNYITDYNTFSRSLNKD